ncbi:MAG TPA: hypothetical protein VIY73_18395, partial [Polyangiaceae bacterium]
MASAAPRGDVVCTSDFDGLARWHVRWPTWTEPRSRRCLRASPRYDRMRVSLRVSSLASVAIAAIAAGAV